MTEVSIIVPVYNAAQFIEECIDSVIAQTVADWELILVDDASTDSSLDICRRYAAIDPRIRVIAAEKGGLSATRNKGLDIAQGNYVTFLDSDDAIPPDALQVLLLHSGSNRIVVGQYFESPENTLHHHRNSDRIYVSSTPDAIIKTLYQVPEFHNSACAKLYPRTFFDHERFTDGKYYEDLESFMRFYLRAEEIVILSRNIYWYRSNPGSFINTLTPARADALWATDTLLDMARRLCPDAVEAARSRRFSAYYNIFGLAAKSHDDEMARRCLSVIRQERGMILRNPHVRIKNKIGAAISYLGTGFMKMACRLIY